MAFTLDGVTLPTPSEYQRTTQWVAAQRRFLDGTDGIDVTANLRLITVGWWVTASQISTLRTRFYVTSPQQLVDDDRGITAASNTYVFTHDSMKVEYLPLSTGSRVAHVSMGLLEHGTTYAGGSTTATEPSAGAGTTWALTHGANIHTLIAPAAYTVTYEKNSIIHQIVNGTIWVDTLGINRKWELNWPALALADIDTIRTCIGYKDVLDYLSPTDYDSASAKVYLVQLPEEMQKLGSVRGNVNITLSEGIASGAAVPAIQVEVDPDGSGYDDYSIYVKSVSLNRQVVADKTGAVGFGGGITADGTITLRHAGGLFSPFNTANRLSTQFYGRSVRISLGWAGSPTVVFTGMIRGPEEGLSGRQATLYVQDLAVKLQNKRADTVLYTNITTGTYLAITLAAAGFTLGSNPPAVNTYYVDAGNYALDWAWMDDETYAQEIEQIIRAEGGRGYINKTGGFVFEAADHLARHLSDIPKAFTVANMGDLGIQWDYDNIYNDVIVEYATRYVAVSQNVYTAQEVYRVPGRITIGTLSAAANAYTVTLQAGQSYPTDTLKGEWIKVMITIAGEYRCIKSNTSASPSVVVVDTPFSGTPTGATYILGGIAEIKAKFQYPVYTITTPVAWTATLQDTNADWDYQACTAGGENKTSNVTLALTTRAASSVIYAINDLAVALYLTRLQIRGQPVLARETKRVERKDQTSIDAYGQRILSVSGDNASVYIQNEAQATSYAELALARMKDPHATVAVSGIKGDATLEVGGLATIVETQSGLTTGTKWLINGIQHQAAPESGFTQSLNMVDAGMLGATSDGNTDWFVIGTSKYGEAGASDGINHAHLWF